MKVLVVAVDLDTFVLEQCNALAQEGVEVLKYKVTGHGVFGYLRENYKLRKEIRNCQPDLIHAHYGLSGLLANLQRSVPVVTTYHGSDIHTGGWILKLSQIAIRLSAFNIFISQRLCEMSDVRCSNVHILPCGVNLNIILSIPRSGAKERTNRSNSFVLFASSFDKSVKNPWLALEAMKRVPEVELVEFKGYSRMEVNLLMNAADCLLMTSHREGSPQVIKEAMACGTPIVSVDVGDVKDIIGNTEGCYIAERNPDDIAEKIQMALKFKGKTQGRQRIIDLGLSNDLVAKRLVEIYEEVRSKRSEK